MTPVVVNITSSSARLSWARGTRFWGFQPSHGYAFPCHPRWLYGDMSCRCCVLTVPDSTGEAAEAAGAPGTGGSWGLPVPAFSGSPRRQLPAGLQGTDFLFGGSSVGLCHGACRGKKKGKQGWACVSPGQGRKDTDHLLLWP